MYLHSILAGILGGLGTPEIILIALVILIFFGGKKIPELMRGIGKGVKSFKEGMNALKMTFMSRKKKRRTQIKEKHHRAKFLLPETMSS